jgi:hypothetical protein
MSVLLAVLLSQGAGELVARLEERAATVRGKVIRSHASGDALDSGELIERTLAVGRLEVLPEGGFWNEEWRVWIGPERKGVTTMSYRAFADRDEFCQVARELRGFGEKMEEKRLETRPRGGAWKALPTLDPWASRDGATSADGLNPLFLYALFPWLFRTEADLKVAASDEGSWVLECRRPWDYGTTTKRFTVRKKDLAFSHAEVVQKGERFTYRYEFEATAFGAVGDQTLPLGVLARYHGFPKVVRWAHRWEPKEAAERGRSRKDLGEPLFASPGLLQRRELELRRVLEPRAAQPLADLAWGEFPREPGWHYRYFETLENNRWMPRALREAEPASASAREEWLRRGGRAGSGDEARILEDAPAPLFNRAAMLLGAGKTAEAEVIVREGLRVAPTHGDRLNWTCLLGAILSKQGKAEDATGLWLKLAAELHDGHFATQVFLAEIALGRGLVRDFDAKTLAGSPESVAAQFALLSRGEGDALSGAVSALARWPVYRPLLSDLVFTRKTGGAAVAKELEAVPDVDTLLAAAAVRHAAGEKKDDLAAAAIAAWEKDSFFQLWTWDAWGRRSLRMLQRLRALGEHEAAAKLASRLVEKCAEGKVPMWLGVYRWGEAVGECLEPLRARGETGRYVELLARSPDLASRIAFRRRDGAALPVREMAEHLGKTRDPEEARGWVRMLGHRDFKGEGVRELVALAREVAPDDLAVANAWLETAVDEVSLEDRAAILRRAIEGMKAGTYSDRTGGNWGMTYERLAKAQVAAGKLEDAVATVREMMRDPDPPDSMSVINLGYAIGNAGRRDLEKELYVLAARSNAHLRPFSAQTVVERLEPLGEHAEIYALAVRTAETWRDGPGRSGDFDGPCLEAVRKAGERAAAKVRWEDVFGPWLERPRPPLAPERARLADEALAELQADEPDRRDRAQRILSLLGDAVVPRLRKPALEGAVEERARVRAVLRRIYAEEWK